MPETERESVLASLLDQKPDTVTASLTRPLEPGLGLRIVRGLGWTLIYLGFLILGFVAHQLFVTDFLADRAQSGLEEEFAARVETARPEVITFDPATGEIGSTDVPGAGTGGLPLFQIERAPEDGAPVGVIRIPAVDLAWTVVEGVDIDSSLKKGAGHYPSTPLPGQPGNAAIAGHRTTYGAPFSRFEELEAGDRIFFDSVVGTHEYEVRQVEVVAPTEVGVIGPRDGSWLTLTTCHPKYSARQRLVVFAELVGGPNFDAIQAGLAALPIGGGG